MLDIYNIDTLIIEDLISENTTLIESNFIKINQINNLIMKNVKFSNTSIDVDVQAFFETQAIKNGNIQYIEFINIKRMGESESKQSTAFKNSGALGLTLENIIFKNNFNFTFINSINNYS